MNQQQDDKTLNLYPIDYPFETLVSRIKANPPKLILNPDFQRKYKWDKEGWERASKFIESCFMRIPLPSCYFAEDQSQKHLVIDGVQRLTTIRRFFDDEFTLEGLTTFKELNGKKFSELGELQAELEATTIRCIILRKENPKKLIREIFSRLNQGAVELSAQEIRHAIYPGKFDDLLAELGANPLIANFGIAVTSDRTKDNKEAEEQVLRFFAFYEKFDSYEKYLKTFLDEYMEAKSEIETDQIDTMRELFNKAIANCKLVFQNDVFSDTTRERKGKQGLVYYDLLMSSIGTLETTIINSKKDAIKNAFTKLCNSEEFRKTLSGGLQNKASIVKRRTLWENLLNDAIK